MDGKHKDDRYFPVQEELAILQHNIHEYFNFPKRSQDRKNYIIETTKQLNEIHAGHWNDKSVRVWFTNNQKLLTEQKPPQITSDQGSKTQAPLPILQVKAEQSPLLITPTDPAPNVPQNNVIQPNFIFSSSSNPPFSLNNNSTSSNNNSLNNLNNLSNLNNNNNSTTTTTTNNNNNNNNNNKTNEETQNMPPLFSESNSRQSSGYPSRGNSGQWFNGVYSGFPSRTNSTHFDSSSSNSGPISTPLNENIVTTNSESHKPEQAPPRAPQIEPKIPMLTPTLPIFERPVLPPIKIQPPPPEPFILPSSFAKPPQTSNQNHNTIQVQIQNQNKVNIVTKNIKYPLNDGVNNNNSVVNKEEEDINENLPTDEEDDLPKLPSIDDNEPDALKLDGLKYELYNKLQNCYHYIRETKKYSPEERLPRQKKVEEVFVELLSFFTNHLGIEQIYSDDRSATKISSMLTSAMRRQFSIATQRYNDDSFVTEPLSSSADENLVSESEFTYFHKNIRLPPDSANLKLFYLGKHTKERITYDINNIEALTFIDCEPIVVLYNESQKIHQIVQGQGDVEHSTGFFFPATSMIVSDNVIWIQGDVRVKAFDRETLECIETLYVRKYNIQKSAIAVWDGNIALGVDDKIYIWSNATNTPPSSNHQKANASFKQNHEEIARQDGIDLKAVDWNKGRQARKIIAEATIKKITAICTVDDKLVVASDEYPVIHIYRQTTNTDFELFASLVGHTMGVTCLFPFKDNKLFSGSKDRTLKLWSIDNGVSELCFLRHGNDITSVTAAEYEAHTFLFSGGKDSRVRVWDITRKKSIFEVDIGKGNFPRGLLFSPEDASLSIVATKISEDYTSNNTIVCDQRKSKFGQYQFFNFDKASS